MVSFAFVSQWFRFAKYSKPSRSTYAIFKAKMFLIQPVIGYISSNHGTCKTRAQVQVQVPTAIIIERLKCLVDLRNLRICNEAVAIRCKSVVYLREKYFHASLKVWKKKRTGSVLIGLSKFSNGTSLRAGSPRDGLGVQPPGQVSLRACLQARKVRAIVRLFGITWIMRSESLIYAISHPHTIPGALMNALQHIVSEWPALYDDWICNSIPT